jgi:DNA-binding NarL/FixJ family response regulator
MFATRSHPNHPQHSQHPSLTNQRYVADCRPPGLTAMKSNFQERIIAILQETPNGLTSNEIAKRLGATGGNLSSRLSKLAAYGIIGKARYSRGGNVYRALTYEQAAAWSPAR